VSRYARWIWRTWRPQLKMLPVLGALTLLSAAVTMAWPQAWRYAVDALSDLAAGAENADRKNIVNAAGILLLVGFGRALRNLYPMLRARVNGCFEMAVRKEYFGRILDKSHRFFLEHRTGDIVTRLTEDISSFLKIAWFLCSGIFRAVDSGVGLIFCVAAMLLTDWRLGLVALAPLPLMSFIWYRVRISLGKRFEQNQKAISETNELLESCYSGIRIVKAYNAEDRLEAQFGEILGRRIEVELGVVKMWSLLDGLYQAIVNLGRVLTIGIGSIWVLDGSLDLGALYAIYLYVDQLVRPMMDIPQFFISGKQVAVCIDRLEGMADFEEGFVDGEGGETPVTRIDRVEAAAVSFRYRDDARREALHEVSLDLPRGGRVAVVGPVGSGKSTLARILAGELRPTGGHVMVNGTPLAELDLSDYRRRVGFIPQESLLFSETIRENVSFGRDITDREVEGAIAIAQMDDEVNSFQKGLKELLGQRGVRVSGGQRQRLAIARALAGHPDLLIMDDVTAALDAENEEALWDDIESRYPDLTAVIITHRLTTAQRADEIVVLLEGRVVDRGGHAELLGRCELYRRLARE
jgi:ATP-binding cassette, subfamily B, multidrug efflux pump